jgi:hypothetical protein
MTRTSTPLLLAATLLAVAVPAQSTATLPVREITAFKDGHAFVLRSGALAPDANGRLVLDELPAPLLGTFWPSVSADHCRLRGVTAGRRLVAAEHAAAELRDLLAANRGASVTVREVDGVRYRAVIADVPKPPAGVVLLRTDETRSDSSAAIVATAGTRVVRLDRIVDVTFVAEPETNVAAEELRPQLVLDVSWTGERTATVPVDLAWVEHGFRWIPGYRVELGDGGKAELRLQATLVNDLLDVEDVTVHLVVGVPSFVAKGELDPIALQEAVAQTATRLDGYRTQQVFGNAYVSQIASNFAANAPAGDGATIADGDAGQKEQDLYVFTVEHVTLKKGERMVLPILAKTVAWTDVYTLDLPLEPPHESWHNFQHRPDELARLMAAPKVMHEVRLQNPGPAPFTTAPALVLQHGRVLAQGTMTYTPPGHGCDLELTTAIDLLVDRDDEETGRQHNAERWNDTSFLRVDLQGHVRIRNRRGEPVQVEIRRVVFGKLDEVLGDGKGRQLGLHDDDGAPRSARPSWRSYPWLWSWWAVAMNGIGEARWTVAIDPGKEADVCCTWHYFWN